MEKKFNQISLGRHPLSVAQYWNSDMTISERVPDHHHLSDTLNWRPDVVSNENGLRT
jgi:hypothetical protein